MTIYIIWLTHELSLIIIWNRSRHPRLLYNLPIINHSNSEGVNNRNIDGAYGIEFPGEHGEEQLGTG